VKEQDDIIVKFRDIGKAEFYPENERTMLRSNGIPMVLNAIVPQPGSNNLEIAEAFYERWESIKKDLPDDIHTAIGFDNTNTSVIPLHRSTTNNLPGLCFGGIDHIFCFSVTGGLPSFRLLPSQFL
jgi:multidrug efflux pump subunit AcrB